jgi:hypothetical protein
VGALLHEVEYFVRLSETHRRPSDPVLEHRGCLAFMEEEGRGASERRSTSHDYMGAIKVELSNLREAQLELPFLSEGLSKPLVCYEAFKLLETDFTDLLKTICNLKENEDAVEDVK